MSMEIKGVTPHIYRKSEMTGYHNPINKKQSIFGSTLVEAKEKLNVSSKSNIILHGKKDADDGEECVGSWASVQSGVSTSVYKPNDFSEDNPYYHVKIWKPDGTLEERMVDVKNYNPKSSDSFEQYAFSCYMSKEEKIPIWNFALGRGTDTTTDLYEKRDWIQEYNDKMQEQYDLGYHEGYMRYKRLYELMLKQFMGGLGIN